MMISHSLHHLRSSARLARWGGSLVLGMVWMPRRLLFGWAHRGGGVQGRWFRYSSIQSRDQPHAACCQSVCSASRVNSLSHYQFRRSWGHLLWLHRVWLIQVTFLHCRAGLPSSPVWHTSSWCFKVYCGSGYILLPHGSSSGAAHCQYSSSYSHQRGA